MFCNVPKLSLTMHTLALKPHNLGTTFKIVSLLYPSTLFSPFNFVTTYFLRYQSMSQPPQMPSYRLQTMPIHLESSQIDSNRHNLVSKVPQLVAKKSHLSLPFAYKLITDARAHRISIKAYLPSSIGHIISSKVASNPRHRTRVAFRTKICNSCPPRCLVRKF